MTVADNYAPAVFTGNGVTTVFPFSFVVYDESHLLVYEKVIATGVRTLISAANYTVSGVPGTGDVTYAPGGSPLPSTKQLELVRLVPYTQALDIENQGGFFANTLEEQLDLTTMQIQQLADASADYLELVAAVEAAEAAQTAAEAAQTGAETAETNAGISEVNAAASAAAAAGSATAADNSATTAAGSATAAATSQSAAEAAAASIQPIPAGGTTGQVLAKTSNTDYAVAWSAAGAGDMLKADNLSGLANPATARTNLGLGTAATQNTGTSGATVPLLNGANTWSDVQLFVTAAAGTAPVRLESTDAGASQGPFLDLARLSASPAVNDALGGIRFRGLNSIATEKLYASFRSRILNATDAAESGALEIVASVGGVQTQVVGFANGLLLAAATGSYQGSGTLNATGYYLNGTELSSTLFGVAVGDASGNLKALNVDGAFTFSTTTTSTNVAGFSAGAWRTAHRFYSYDAATYAGNRYTMAIMRNYNGSGENGPTRADNALHLEILQDDYLNNTTIGEGDTLRIFNRKGRNGDAAGILINMTKVESASYGALIWEATSSWEQAGTGTVLRQIRASSGHQGPATDLRGEGTGFKAQVSVGDNNAAFIATQQDSGQWKYAFLAADGIAYGTEYFYLTGPAHANGKGYLNTYGAAHLMSGIAVPSNGNIDVGLKFSTTPNFGIYFGIGAPTSVAAKGSLYLRRDGSTTTNRAYINTDGSNAWTAITTAA